MYVPPAYFGMIYLALEKINQGFNWLPRPAAQNKSGAMIFQH